MFGFIKNLFSGIFSFFIGLLGGKKAEENKPSIKAAEKPAAPTAEKPAAANDKKRKRSSYFMELDESEDVKFLNEPVAAVKQAVEKTKNATVEAANKVVLRLARSMLIDARMRALYWPWAVRHACYIVNRLYCLRTK